MQFNYNVMQNVRIINEIIGIEARARELIKNAETEQAELPRKISEILDAYKTQQHEKALEKIKNINIAEEKSAKDKTEKIRREHDEKLEKLKKIVDENMDSWVEEIYSFIIKPTQI